MNGLDDEDLLFANMVNQHSDEIRKNAVKNSVGKEEVQYNQTKKKNSDKWRTALVAVMLVSSIMVGVMGYSATHKNVDTASNSVSYTKEDKQEIDEKINEYIKLMDKNGPEETRIEIVTGHNDDNPSDPYVDYYTGVLVNDVVEASKLDRGVLEARCALIAAYNVINETCREKQFDKVFNSLKKNEKFRNNTETGSLGSFNFDDSIENIWQMLGYKDEEDFYKNAREDARTFNAVVKNMESKDGKRL